MSFFSRLLGKTDDSPLGYVLEVSDGLRAYGQREIAIAVRLRRRESEEEVRKVLRSFLALVRGFATNGRLVDDGGITEFGPRGFLDPKVRGVGYGWYGGNPELGIPEDALVGTLLFADEIQLARATSVARVLTRLGEVTREFPFPLVSDRDRASVVSRRDGESMLSSVARIVLPSLSVVLENDTVVLSARPGTGPSVAEAFEDLPPGAAFALICSRAPRADGHLVWTPGQEGPAAISKPGAAGLALSGAMLLVATGQEADQVLLREDGFALLARDETWAAVQQALVDGTSYELAAAHGGHGLRVEHLREGQYLPAGGVRNPEEIELLTPDGQLRAAIEIEVLGDYIKRLIANLPDGGVELHVELSDSGVELSTSKSLEADVEAALREVEIPSVRGPVAFVIRRSEPS